MVGVPVGKQAEQMHWWGFSFLYEHTLYNRHLQHNNSARYQTAVKITDEFHQNRTSSCKDLLSTFWRMFSQVLENCPQVTPTTPCKTTCFRHRPQKTFWWGNSAKYTLPIRLIDPARKRILMNWKGLKLSSSGSNGDGPFQGFGLETKILCNLTLTHSEETIWPLVIHALLLHLGNGRRTTWMHWGTPVTGGGTPWRWGDGPDVKKNGGKNWKDRLKKAAGWLQTYSQPWSCPANNF